MAEVLFFDIFCKKDPHLNATENDIGHPLIKSAIHTYFKLAEIKA